MYTAICIVAVIAAVSVACTRPASERMDMAEAVVDTRPDSALVILRDIDFDRLDDADRARYVLTRAMAGVRLGRSPVADSLLPLAMDYYRMQCDTIPMIKSALLYANYLYALDESSAAVEVLDDMIDLLPTDSVDMQYELRSNRSKINIMNERYDQAADDVDWLIYHTRFDGVRFRHAALKFYMLYVSGRSDDAVAWADTVTGADYFAGADATRRAEFLKNYAEILDERGLSRRAIAIVEDVLADNPGLSDADKAGCMVFLAKFNANAGDMRSAQRYLAAADSLHPDADDEYRGYLRSAIRFRETGYLSLTPDKRIADDLRRQRRISTDAIAEMNDLSARKMELTLAKQRLWLTVMAVSLALVLTLLVGGWLLRRRRRRLAEAEERIDTLTEMMHQVSRRQPDDKHALLKKMVLQQMGVLKTFASAPTSHNQEVLRKITSVGAEEDACRLVDWSHLYAMIDELYDGFHKRLMARYPGLFTEKEVQIICLLRADFSTKEIGVLTEQSSATIYVRKSAVRKKLGAAEGADIVALIRRETDGLDV